jgi:lysophospholipase L1-like esterase
MHCEGHAMAMKTRQRSLRRRWCFPLAAVLLGLSPFVITELTLRVTDVATVPTYVVSSNPLSAIDQDPLVDLHALRPLFVASADGERMEIGPSRMNFFCPASFPVSKAPGTFRVFALGGSTTQGQPYRTETALPKWFELRLKAAWPDRNVEVINCGGISYASYRVAAILDEVLTHEPDLIVLYTGHNEFLEARTYARQRLVPRWAAPALATIAELRLARVTSGLLDRLTPTVAPPSALPVEVDTLLDHPGGMHQYRRDEQWMEQVHAHFAVTLQRMILACRGRDVPLVMCIPASDLVNTPPFKSELDPLLTSIVRQQAERLVAVISDSSAESASRVEAAERLLQIDPCYAQSHYVIGTALYHRGDAAAAEHLLAARDCDVCPLRATATIERTIRELSAEYQLPLVDTPALFDVLDHRGALVPDRIADPSRFVDHVHPTIEGHQLIGAEIFRQLMLHGLIASERDDQEMQHAYLQLQLEHLATLGESYYGRAQQRLQGVRRWTGRP